MGEISDPKESTVSFLKMKGEYSHSKFERLCFIVFKGLKKRRGKMCL